MKPVAGEFWRGKHFCAIDAGTDDFPAFIRIVALDHVAEMSDLSSEDRSTLRALLDTTERVMIDNLHPDKMNWAQFGNMVPHLHWHLVARWRDDGWYPECPWGPRQRQVSKALSQERRCKVKALLPLLAEALSVAEATVTLTIEGKR